MESDTIRFTVKYSPLKNSKLHQDFTSKRLQVRTLLINAYGHVGEFRLLNCPLGCKIHCSENAKNECPVHFHELGIKDPPTMVVSSVVRTSGVWPSSRRSCPS